MLLPQITQMLTNLSEKMWGKQLFTTDYTNAHRFNLRKSEPSVVKHFSFSKIT